MDAALLQGNRRIIDRRNSIYHGLLRRHGHATTQESRDFYKRMIDNNADRLEKEITAHLSQFEAPTFEPTFFGKSYGPRPGDSASRYRFHNHD